MDPFVSLLSHDVGSNKHDLTQERRVQHEKIFPKVEFAQSMDGPCRSRRCNMSSVVVAGQLKIRNSNPMPPPANIIVTSPPKIPKIRVNLITFILLALLLTQEHG